MPARPVGDYAEMAVPSRGGNKEPPPLKPGQRSPGGSPRSGRGRPARSPGRQVPGGARGVRKGGGGRRGGRSEPPRGCREAAAAGRLRDALGRGPLGLLRVCGERLRGGCGGLGGPEGDPAGSPRGPLSPQGRGCWLP